MSHTRSKSKRLFNATESASTCSATFQISDKKHIAIQVVATESCLTASVLSACTDVCVTCNSFAEAAHGFLTGLKGQLTTTGGVCCDDLPAGLCLATDYFVIKVDACTYKLASSRANAVAGTAICISDAGTGCHTFTPASADCSSATVCVTYSNDGSTYAADSGVGIAQVVVGACGVTTIDQSSVPVAYQFMKVALDVTDSQWSFTVDVNAKD